jgi:hypothetical protein
MASALRLVSHQFREFAATSGSVFIHSGSVFTDSGSVFTDSGSVFTDSGSVFTHSGSVFTHSGSVFTHSGSVFTDSGSVFTDSGSVFTHSGSVFTHSGSVFTHSGVREPSPDTALVRPCEQLSPGQTSHLVCQLSFCYCRGRPAYSRRCELWHRLFCIAELHPTPPSKR